MSQENRRESRIIGNKGLALLFAVLVIIPIFSFAEDMTMSPHKIILNAKGQFDDVQAVIRIAMQPGYTLTDYQVTLTFNGVAVSEAFDFRYCPIDDNFLASFDRTAIQANPDVMAMAGTTVTAVVEGWFESTAFDGTGYVQEFSCSDPVDIVDPDKK